MVPFSFFPVFPGESEGLREATRTGLCQDGDRNEQWYAQVSVTQSFIQFLCSVTQDDIQCACMHLINLVALKICVGNKTSPLSWLPINMAEKLFFSRRNIRGEIRFL